MVVQDEIARAGEGLDSGDVLRELQLACQGFIVVDPEERAPLGARKILGVGEDAKAIDNKGIRAEIGNAIGDV